MKYPPKSYAHLPDPFYEDYVWDKDARLNWFRSKPIQRGQQLNARRGVIGAQTLCMPLAVFYQQDEPFKSRALRWYRPRGCTTLLLYGPSLLPILTTHSELLEKYECRGTHPDVREVIEKGCRSCYTIPAFQILGPLSDGLSARAHIGPKRFVQLHRTDCLSSIGPYSFHTSSKIVPLPRCRILATWADS